MNQHIRSQSSTSSTTGSSGGIGWDWGNIFNSTNLESISCEGSDGRLGTWTWSLGVNTTSSSEFDVNSLDTDILHEFADIDGSEHGSIWRRFFSISLNFHSTGDSAVSFSSGKISDVDESVVESGEHMDNTEVVVSFSSTSLWWTEIGLFFFLNFNFLLWWLYGKERLDSGD